MPRKDDTFRISFVGEELKQSLRLRRGMQYNVRLQLCNKFGCSKFFERGLEFFVPTTTPTPTTTVSTAKITANPKDRGGTLVTGPNAATGLWAPAAFMKLLLVLMILSRALMSGCLEFVG